MTKLSRERERERRREKEEEDGEKEGERKGWGKKDRNEKKKVDSTPVFFPHKDISIMQLCYMQNP